MLDIFRNSKKKTTTAVIKDSAYDAVNHIEKKLGLIADGDLMEPEVAEVFEPSLSKAIMNNTYTGTVKCDERDTYDEAVGEDEAVKKAMANHKNGFTKAIVRWQAAAIKRIIEVSPETFDDALRKVHTCSCHKNK